MTPDQAPASGASSAARRYRGPAYGTVLSSDHEGAAIVVAEGTEPIDALLELVAYHHGEGLTRANPVLLETASDLRLEVWRSCTKPWREANGATDWDDYWAPDGDGARECHVLFVPDDLYELGREAEDAEPTSASPDSRPAPDVPSGHQGTRVRGAAVTP